MRRSGNFIGKNYFRGASCCAPASILIFILWVILCGFNPFLKQNSDVKAGNEAYSEGKFEQAREKYDEASTKAGASPETSFNKGDAFFKLGKFDEAYSEYMKATSTNNRDLKSKSLYNAGNAMARSGKTGEALEAYIQSLMTDPKNMDAKYNLELLLKMQQQQQEQQKQNQQKDQKDRQEEKKEKKKDALDRMNEQEKPMPKDQKEEKEMRAFGRRNVEKDW